VAVDDRTNTSATDTADRSRTCAAWWATLDIPVRQVLIEGAHRHRE